MEFLPEEIQQYSEEHTQPESELLNKINRETNLHVLKPRMLSGHMQGRILSMLSNMIQPKRILEVGTYTGYATLCLAEGLKKDGKIITLDINEELAPRTQSYFNESQYAHQIIFKIGNALEIIPSLDEKWDLVFIDADKINYAKYYELVVPQMNPNGFIIADNVLWSGKVVNPDAKDEDTKAIRQFNKQVHQDSRVENVLFPVRDGLMVLQVK